MPMPQYNGPYNLQGYQPTFGYNPQQIPAYTVPNPNGYYGCQQNCYQSCGC